MATMQQKKAQEVLSAKAGQSASPFANNRNTMATGPQQPSQQRPMYCPPRDRCPRDPCDGIDWDHMRCGFAKFMAELAGTFIIGIVVALRDTQLLGGFADPGPIALGFAIALVATGFRLAFMPFGAGHFNPAYTFMQWCCEKKLWDFWIIGNYIALLLGQFLGFLLSAWLISAVVAAPLSCTIINPLVGNGFGFLFESLAILLLIHIFVLVVHNHMSSMMNAIGVLGLGFAEFALIAGLSGISGGSINFFRSTGVALVQGAPCTSSLGIYVGALFAAVAVAIVFLLWVFPAKCASQVEKTVIEHHDRPPAEKCDK